MYRRFCFGDAAFSGRLNPKQFELAFQARNFWRAIFERFWFETRERVLLFVDFSD